MFSKILIANRGEIACRVIKTARRMGIATVAVYSEADAGAKHVTLADEAVAIGPAPSAESYLVIDRVVQAARDTGAEAIHPGYGFLSENARFARTLAENDIVFIGPPEGAIAAMGDKIESKKLAQRAGVNTIPGHIGEIADDEEALKIADEIGYPVMIKASAGGGGKGMRLARSAKEVREGFRGARSEAKSSFGDDRIFIEKFIERPRHIEIQIIGDKHGKIVHLNERECSVQRRHQKVIEEAPSPFVDARMRKAMGEQAIALARAVDYHSAGTVEFVAGADKSFYFLEMNTRLQVEHPVTEMITGLDLVELMIRVAAGEALAVAQTEVSPRGWAAEARIYAEDPSRGFLPSIGRLSGYSPPAETETVRVDDGVQEGSEISLYYDPMIAKLICHGADRLGAIHRMQQALDRFWVQGVKENISFLAAVFGHETFQAGDLTTGFIDESFPDGYDGGVMPLDVRAVIAGAAVFVHRRRAEIAASLSGRRDDGRYQPADEWVVVIRDDTIPVTVSPIDGGYHIVGLLPGGSDLLSDWRPGQPVFEGMLGTRPIAVQVEPLIEGYRLRHGGGDVAVLVRTPLAQQLAARMPRKEPPDLSKVLLSPMPGLVVSVAVEPGQEVKAGDEVCTIDAMKMENVLRATSDAVVEAIHIGQGDSVAVDEILVTFT